VSYSDRSLTSFDGTRIAYRIGGDGDRWLVIANGYGGTYAAWDDVLSRLDCRYLIWDYRGLHRSATPDDPANLRVSDHCRDLDLIREVERIDRMVLAGWSVGCQVALEQYRRTPDQVDALALINGAHGRVIERSVGYPRVMRSTLRTLRRAAPILGPGMLPPLRLMARRRFTGPLLRRVGLFNGESPSLVESARAVLDLDYRIYSHMILLADDHDTDDLLETIDVPTVVVAGDRDAITPTELARSIADRIPTARYVEVPGATHYGVMEFPDTYAAVIRDLMGTRSPHSTH
jgi:pimeloyl-ACP methyl ester carboxylesterase